MSDQSKSGLDREIVDFYNQTPEEDRLEQGPFQLEQARTRELIERHAPPAPATVLDIGGAAGVYALWLAERGYDVHLIDAVPRLVEEARRRSASLPRKLASARVGDARALPVADDSVSLALMLGPLYHLTDRADRLAALREAKRVLAPGGVLVAAAISRWASALDGLSRNLFADRRFAGIVERDLREGQHRNDTERLDFFTTAYFHRPDDLRTEPQEAGLSVEGVYGIEGPAWMFPDFDERWQDPERREVILSVARMLETESSVVGCSAHLLVVARK
jgi:SAM-dependent methyltransferase